MRVHLVHVDTHEHAQAEAIVGDHRERGPDVEVFDMMPDIGWKDAADRILAWLRERGL